MMACARHNVCSCDIIGDDENFKTPEINSNSESDIQEFDVWQNLLFLISTVSSVL